MVLLRLRFLIKEMTDFNIAIFPFLDGDIPRSTQFSPRSQPRQLVGKRTAQNRTSSKTSIATARRTAVYHTGGQRQA